MLSTNGHFDRWILGVVLAFQALVCCSFYSREIAWYPPLNFDQTTFLAETYHLEERILGHGWGEIWKVVRSKDHASGLLLPIEGALSGLVVGGARWPQLVVNFVLFGALQIFAFYTARKVWGRRAYGYAVAGLFSFDVISGWLNAGTITTSGYEQSGELIEFHPMLGNGIMGVGASDAVSLLANSDFLILTTLQKEGVFPFYRRIAQYWNDLKGWADQNMILVRTVPFDSFAATVYARPSAVLSGLSGGWVTPDGLLIEAPRVTLQRFPKIRLVGRADYSRLPSAPSVSATIDAAAGQQLIPASFKRVDTGYEITIDTSLVELPPSDNIILQLHFSTFFIPKNAGRKDDARELVVRTPTLVQLIRHGS